MMILSRVYFLTTLFLCLLCFLLDLFCFGLYLPFMVEAVLKFLVFLRCQIVFNSEAQTHFLWKYECSLSICEFHYRVETMGSFVWLGESPNAASIV